MNSFLVAYYLFIILHIANGEIIRDIPEILEGEVTPSRGRFQVLPDPGGYRQELSSQQWSVPVMGDDIIRTETHVNRGISGRGKRRVAKRGRKMVDNRGKRQAIESDPTEVVKCQFPRKKCSRREGRCISFFEGRLVCKSDNGNEIDVNGQQCLEAQQLCHFDICKETLESGRCISLRGGLRACKGDNEPFYLMPGDDECQY